MISDLHCYQKNHLGFITLSRPQALNALTLSMIKTMLTQLKLWEKDDSIQAIVLQADGEKAFCAGGDVRWLYDRGQVNQSEVMAFFSSEYQLNQLIHDYPKPYIALLNGITMGGGVGISLHGSFPIASETFQFAMPETTIGFFPDIGASYLLAQAPGAMGIYLGLTGQRLGAIDALFCHLVKAVIPSHRFSELLKALMALDLKMDAFELVEECIASFTMPVLNAPIAKQLDVINRCFSLPDIEAILLELEQVDSDWSRETHANLLSKSPLSLKVTLEQLRRARSLSMADCIKMDYDLAGHFMADHDFFEGVRALLVDKDKSPQWQPNTLADVSEARIHDYFVSTKALSESF